MIARTMRGAMYAGGFLGNSTVWRYAKKRGLWYYRLLLSNRFADVMSDIFEMTELEKKLNKDNWNSPVKKKIFMVDEDGYIFDNTTGEVFGNVKDGVHNKFDMDIEKDENTINMPDETKEQQ